MNLMQAAEVSSNAIVAIVTTQHLIQVHHLFPYWQMPHSPHQVTQVGYAASKPRLLSTKAHFESAFPVVRAIEGETQKVNRLWSFPASFASIPVGKSAKLNQLCFRRLQCQAEFFQAFTQHILKADGVLTVLETHHKVINIAHQIGFALQP